MIIGMPCACNYGNEVKLVPKSFHCHPYGICIAGLKCNTNYEEGGKKKKKITTELALAINYVAKYLSIVHTSFQAENKIKTIDWLTE